jgi:hypothetical protein
MRCLAQSRVVRRPPKPQEVKPRKESAEDAFKWSPLKVAGAVVVCLTGVAMGLLKRRRRPQLQVRNQTWNEIHRTKERHRTKSIERKNDTERNPRTT